MNQRKSRKSQNNDNSNRNSKNNNKTFLNKVRGLWSIAAFN